MLPHTEASRPTPDMHNADHTQALLAVDRLTRIDWNLVRENRETFRHTLLKLGGYLSFDQALKDIGSRTVIPIIAGGVATRWEKSFESDNAKAVLKNPEYIIIRGRPRGLTRVPNKLPRDIWADDTIPVFGYTLWETKDIPGAKRVVIHPEEATKQDLIEMEQTAETLGLQIQLRPQVRRTNNLKPSGHGDAIVQNIDILDGTDFVLPQFVSDASSPTTIKDALLTLAVLSKCGLPIDVVVPTVSMEQPKYSVFIDKNGLIRKMGHAKLLGEESLGGINTTLTISGSQIGIYPFTTRAMREELENKYATYLNERSYVFLPGHANGVNEFAIDDAVLSLAAKGRVRQLAIANESEIASSAKTVDTLPRYVQMMEAAIQDSEISSNRNSDTDTNRNPNS